MAENKTKETKANVDNFINATKDENVIKDCQTLIKMMKSVTKEEPKMWGPSIIGFGKYHYKYATGREGDMCLTGFSPRKGKLSIYLLCDLESQRELLDKLGKHKNGKSCLYVKSLKDVDLKILKELVTVSVKYTKDKYPDK